MKKQRWRFTKGKQYKCYGCGFAFDKRYLDEGDKNKNYIYCSTNCHMHDVGMSWSDFI